MSFFYYVFLLLEFKSFTTTTTTYLIVEAQLNTLLRNQQAIRMHDSKALVSYSTTISNVASVLKHYKYEGDLRSSATLPIPIEKLPPNLKEKWWFYVDETNEDRPDLCVS